MKLALTTVLGDQPQIWPLDGPRIRIGRARSNTVQISAPSVSREHAEIAVKGDRLLLKDLHSRNGTWLNGVRVRRSVVVKPGDRIQVGRIWLNLAERPPEGAGRPVSPSETSDTLEVPASDFISRSVGISSRPGELVRLLEKAGRLLVQQRSLRHTCEEFLEAVEDAVPASRLALLLGHAPGSEPTQLAARRHGVSVVEPHALPVAAIRAVLDRRVAVFISPAAVAVPLLHEGKALGLLYASHDDPRFRYTRDNLEVLMLFANLAAMRVTNEKLVDAEKELARIEHELVLASRIQRWLLPGTEPSIPGYDFHARLEPCEEVGGDFYDAQLMPDGTAWLIAGDVSGKGIGAAIIMSVCLSSARVLYEGCEVPRTLATRLNTLLTRWTRLENFATVFIGKLSPPTGVLRYVNAGHPAPLLLAGRTVRRLDSTGVPLGVVPAWEYEEAEVTLSPGALLAAFSDGVPETRRGQELFGDRRVDRAVKAAAQRPSLDDAGGAVIREVDAFRGPHPREDDITLVFLRRASAMKGGRHESRL